MNLRFYLTGEIPCIVFLLCGCVPQFIPPGQSHFDHRNELKVSKEEVSRQNQKNLRQSTIYPVDSQTFNILIPNEDVWNAAINVLMRNYNLTIVDKQNGVITTEWDSFYLDRQVFRNKISLRITPFNYRHSKLMIINNIETLQESSSAGTGAFGSVWVPSQDVAGESARIVKGIAAILRQPPPVIPPDMISQANQKNQSGYLK